MTGLRSAIPTAPSDKTSTNLANSTTASSPMSMKDFFSLPGCNGQISTRRSTFSQGAIQPKVPEPVAYLLDVARSS